MSVYAHDFFDAIHVLEFLANCLDICHVMHFQLDFAVEYAVLCVDGQLADINVQFAGENVGDAAQDSKIVDAADFDCGREKKCFVYVPVYGQDMIAVARLQFGCYGTLPFVNVDAVVAVDISQDIVSRTRVATVSNDEMTDFLFIQH